MIIITYNFSFYTLSQVSIVSLIKCWVSNHMQEYDWLLLVIINRSSFILLKATISQKTTNIKAVSFPFKSHHSVPLGRVEWYEQRSKWQGLSAERFATVCCRPDGFVEKVGEDVLHLFKWLTRIIVIIIIIIIIFLSISDHI